MSDDEQLKSNIFFVGDSLPDLEIIHLINKNLNKMDELEGLKIPKFSITSLSVRMVKKFYITAGEEIGKNIKPNELIEIVDYDPVRDSALATGSSKPTDNLPLHWFIYRAFPMINSIANIRLTLTDKKLGLLDIASIDAEIKIVRPEDNLKILSFLKDKNRIYFEDKGLILFDNSVGELMDSIIGVLKELSEIEAAENNNGGS